MPVIEVAGGRTELSISIVTVVFNNLKGLKKTAASVLAQDCARIEWVIVDGGSTDGTAEFVAQLGARVAKFVSEKDRGIYDAMNKGLTLASGDYVIFMNGGDVFASDEAVSHIAHAARSAGSPDLIFGESSLQFPDGRLVGRRVKAPARYIRHGQPALHQATAFRREVHLKRPYDFDYRVCADYAAVAAIMADGGTWSCVAKPISVNAVGGEEFSNSHRRQLFSDPWRIQRDILRLPLHARLLSMARRHLSTALIDLLSAPGRWKSRGSLPSRSNSS